jgi:uncharacterized SAM-binding protein YcdF (DUF218 family)
LSGRLLRWLGGTVLIGFLLTAFTPAVELIGSWLGPDRPAERAEAIVVLGAGGVTAAGALTDKSLRGTMEGVSLFRQGWAPVLVLSGGEGRGRRTEAAARADFARQSGVPEAATMVAPPAHTTREEAVRLQALLQPRGVRKVLLVVDRTGTRRAKAAFERMGFEVVPAPWGAAWNLDATPEARLGLLRSILMELAACLYYRAMGFI